SRESVVGRGYGRLRHVEGIGDLPHAVIRLLEAWETADKDAHHVAAWLPIADEIDPRGDLVFNGFVDRPPRRQHSSWIAAHHRRQEGLRLDILHVARLLSSGYFSPVDPMVVARRPRRGTSDTPHGPTPGGFSQGRPREPVLPCTGDYAFPPR